MNSSSEPSQNNTLWRYFSSGQISQWVKNRKVDLLLRMGAIYLTFWWTTLFVVYVNDRDPLFMVLRWCGIGSFVFGIAHSGLWFASTSLGKKYRWLLLLILVPCLIFYVQSVISRQLPTYLLGMFAYLIAIANVSIRKPIDWRKK